MLTKTKRVRLKGKALWELNAAIHERDGYSCIICGCYVDIGVKFHHEPCGAHKSDEMGKGVTLCFDCHQERHFGANSKEVKTKIVEYLEALENGY